MSGFKVVPLMSEPQLLKKSEFAAAKRVSSARVSQWIAAGIIGPEAIVGTGQRAKINAKIASAQLRESFDVEQRFRLNGPSTNHDDEPEERLKVERDLTLGDRGGALRVSF
jgi:hypothetical protein